MKLLNEPVDDTSHVMDQTQKQVDFEKPDDVLVVDETILNVVGDKEHTLHWPEYSLQIDIPKGSLPSGRTVELQVKAIVAGHFILPPDCHLVSGIYWINCPEWFDKKVTLHLPHAAIIESEEASHFRFYAAKCSSGSPYQFRELRDGHFTPFSKSASIALSQFSHLTMGKRGRPKQRYYSKVFYRLKQPQEWDVFFVIIKDDPAFGKFIREKYCDCSDGVCQTVKLKDDARCIKLIPKRDCLDRWKMTQLISSQIDKEDIDYFTPERALNVPHCHFNFCWISHLPLKMLNQRFLLVGAIKPNDFFHVILPHGMSTDITYGSIEQKPPEIPDVFDLIKNELSASWNEFGGQLGVSLNDRDILRKNISLSDSSRLEGVIAIWV